ncbi:hypothetical protein GTE6_3 [Gordonia phage GTE6]|uniref:Uncharacterized protein n=1 Tax=Gordonia phage GTE6 TaxID=1647474 RepID=A0A0K0MWY1_9CAUD|nr:hypothetical protein AU100_gp03 [Gordonia phage GTE6]AKI28645.1 hypothetical protein GTE6_3 [Gordonia phage GTE6]
MNITAEQVKPGAQLRLDSTTTVIVTNVAEHFPACTRCGAANVEDAGDHADNAGHWPVAAEFDHAGLAVTVLQIFHGHRFDRLRTMTLMPEAPLLQSSDADRWRRWATPAVERCLAAVPDDHPLYDDLADELAERAHEADVRRMNGGVLP